MMYHFKKGDDLDFAIAYAKGWNDALKEAAAIARGYDLEGSEFIAADIEQLDRSMKACDD